ncbi:MAG: hypothetical protein HFI90_07095 [Clostridia bacterium]|nr:hypothetical protein [Clostridia bacterium]
MKVDIIVLLGAIGALSGIIFSYIGYQRGKNKDTKNEGENTGVLISDVGYIKAGVDDLKKEQRETNKSVNALSERVTRVEESTKQAHKRIDGLEEKT